jgi:hypothetical protein
MKPFTVLRSRLRSRRALIGSLAALALLGGAVPLGRWEMHHHATDENARMATVFRAATAHGLRSRALYGYRLDQRFDCLAYSAPPGPYALELCFDPQGRLVETIDRRRAHPSIASLREQPSLATLRVPMHQLLPAFRAAGAFRDSRLRGVILHPGALPVGFSDIGVLSHPSR